jgi:hypothetical protein
MTNQIKTPEVTTIFTRASHGPEASWSVNKEKNKPWAAKSASLRWSQRQPPEATSVWEQAAAAASLFSAARGAVGLGEGDRDPVPRCRQGTNKQYRALQTEPLDRK